MHIVHVVQGLGSGGQAGLILDLCMELARRGHEAAIITLTLGGELRARAVGVRVHDVPRAKSSDPSLVVRLAHLLYKERPDVVHTHDSAPLLHAVPASLLTHVGRRIHTKHGPDTYGRRGLWAARALVRVMDAFVAVSPQAADAARAKEHVPERCLRVVPDGIPVALTADAYERLYARTRMP
jgi:hypothetical protein